MHTLVQCSEYVCGEKSLKEWNNWNLPFGVRGFSETSYIEPLIVFDNLSIVARRTPHAACTCEC